MLSLLGTLIIGLNNRADRRSNREAHRPWEGTGRLSHNDGNRRRWFFCRVLPRKITGLDFWTSRQLATGRLYPVTDWGHYPAAYLPLDTPENGTLTCLGDSPDEGFVHFREGRPLCRPIVLPFLGSRND